MTEATAARRNLGERIALAALLAAAAALPAFANPNGLRVFEEDRAILLRLLLLPGLAAAVLGFGRPRRPGLAAAGLLLYVAASAVAAFASELPAAALPGDYVRQHGLLTDLALAGAFAAAALAARRRPEALALALDLLLAGGAALAALGVAEALGLAGPFGALETARARSYAGGPTFLGGVLAALLPLALALRRPWLAALLAVGIAASASRAALLAAAAGIAFSWPSLEPRWRRWILRGAALSAALVAVLCLPPLRARLPPTALPNRVLAALQGADARVRGLLWRDAAAALAADPARLALGHGPDSIAAGFAPRVSHELQTALGGKTRVDRFHSALLDVLYTRGAAAALGLLAMVAAALRAARRDPRSIALGGAALAASVDALLGVPSAASLFVLFAACGAAAARREAPLAERPLDPAIPGALAGAGLAGTWYAGGSLVHAWPGLAFLLLLRGSGARALLAAAIALVAFAVPHVAIVGAVATRAAPLGAAAAEQARLDTLLAPALWLACGAFAAALLAAPARPPAPIAKRRAGWHLALAALLALCVARAAADDLRRLLADADAGAAAAIERAGARPGDAARLWRSAAARAPEVAEYGTREALALAAAAEREQSTAEARVLEAGTAIGRALERTPQDPWQRARAAHAIVRFARALPAQAPGLWRRAAELAEPAVNRAPTACPVLEIAAEVRLALGQTDGAVLLLDRVLGIDGSRGAAWLLRGRAAAAGGDAVAAATYYGGALARGHGTPECRAALALLAAAAGRYDDGASLLAPLTLALPDGEPFDVEGARPLLLHVPADRWISLMDALGAAVRGDSARVQRVRDALAYTRGEQR